MINTYSPAYFVSADESSAAPPVVATRYPEPAGLRWLRWQLGALWALAPALGSQQAWRVFTTPRRLPVKAWEGPALAEARRRTVMAETGPFAVYEWGPAAAAAVLRVHGWEHRASFWRAWVGPLQAAGYRVVALDGPAHGASAGRRTTLTDFGGAVQAVVNTLGEVRAIVAHSFGAASVAGLPVRLPEGVALPRLALISAPEGPRVVAERFAEFLRLPADLVRHFAGYVERRTGRPIRSPWPPRGRVPVPSGCWCCMTRATKLFHLRKVSRLRPPGPGRGCTPRAAWATTAFCAMPRLFSMQSTSSSISVIARVIR